jgi:hypothetical protein
MTSRFHISNYDLLDELTTGRIQQPVKGSRSRDPTPRQVEPFIKGPFPLHQYRLACHLPGAALIVWQLVQHQRVMRRQQAATLPDKLGVQFGISRTTKWRAICALSQAGLLRVHDHGKGRTFTLEPVDLSKETCERLIAKLTAQPRVQFTERVVNLAAARARKRKSWKGRR